jgi:hypothetical protein
MHAREGEIHDRAAWQERLALSGNEFDELASLQVFTASADKWRLQLVGSVFLKRGAFACLPAALPHPDIEPRVHVEQTANVLRQYQSRSAARRVSMDRLGSTPTFNAANRRAFRQVEALLGLIDFTGQYGFHTEAAETTRQSESAPVDWSKTVQRCMPTKVGHSFAYFEPQTRGAVPLTSRLGVSQAATLIRLTGRYLEVLPGTLAPAHDLVDQAQEVVQNNVHLQLLATRRDLLDAFDATNLDHEKELAALLLASNLEDDTRSAGDEGIGVLGTIAFEQVWEDMCRVALGADDELAGFELSNPHLALLDGRDVLIRPQRPDTAFRHDEQIYIVDAKYYPTFPQSIPGLEDLRKQVFYVASARGGTPKTALCFPGTTPGGIQKVGESTFRFQDGSVDTRFGSVKLLKLDWQIAVGCYLSRRPDPQLRTQIASMLG